MNKNYDPYKEDDFVLFFLNKCGIDGDSICVFLVSCVLGYDVLFSISTAKVTGH